MNICSSIAWGTKLDTLDEFPMRMQVLVVDSDPSSYFWRECYTNAITEVPCSSLGELLV